MKKTTIHFPDFITFLNLIFGFLSLYFASKSLFLNSAIFMLCAVFFDFIDGKFARWLKIDSELGKNLDSLSDLVSFGVAPAFFLVSFFNDSLLILIISLLFVVAGSYRLARFNITNQKGFIGMPITVNGLIIPILYFTGLSNIYFYSVLLLVSSFLMVSKIRIKKL